MFLRIHMVGWAIWRAVIHNDTVEGLMVAQDALDDGHYARLTRRVADDPSWQRISETRPRLHTRMVRRADVRRLPETSFGGALREHMVQNGFLEQPVIPASPFDTDPDVAWTKTRWRECHDARHAITGLRPTPADEARLHAFQLAQHVTWFGVLVCLLVPLFAWQRTNPLQTWLRLPDAYRAGRDARLLLDLDVEGELATPVRRLRHRYRVRPLGPGPARRIARGPIELRQDASVFAADEKERTAWLLATTLMVFGLSVAAVLGQGPSWLSVLAVLGLVASTVRLTAFAQDVQQGAILHRSRVARRLVVLLDVLSGGALAAPEVRAFAPDIPFYRRAEAAEALSELRSGEAGYGPACPTPSSSWSASSADP